MIFYAINAIKKLRKPCRKNNLFEEYFAKYKRIKAAEAYFRFSTVLEYIFYLIVIDEIFHANGNYMT